MESYISGIPCWIEVDYIHIQKPNSNADNPDDYYGYSDVEFTVCDRRGRPAPWLERKMSDNDGHRIKAEILEQA